LVEDRIVVARELPFEFALNALRLKSEWTRALFESRTGLPIDTIATQLHHARERKLLTGSVAAGWQPTEMGQRFLNDLQAIFLAEEGH
jgi:oxygen-independent coproporphyrinogen-3 oxidase